MNRRHQLRIRRRRLQNAFLTFQRWAAAGIIVWADPGVVTKTVSISPPIRELIMRRTGLLKWTPSL